MPRRNTKRQSRKHSSLPDDPSGGIPDGILDDTPDSAQSGPPQSQKNMTSHNLSVLESMLHPEIQSGRRWPMAKKRKPDNFNPAQTVVGNSRPGVVDTRAGRPLPMTPHGKQKKRNARRGRNGSKTDAFFDSDNEDYDSHSDSDSHSNNESDSDSDSDISIGDDYNNYMDKWKWLNSILVVLLSVLILLWLHSASPSYCQPWTFPESMSTSKQPDFGFISVNVTTATVNNNNNKSKTLYVSTRLVPVADLFVDMVKSYTLASNASVLGDNLNSDPDNTRLVLDKSIYYKPPAFILSGTGVGSDLFRAHALGNGTVNMTLTVEAAWDLAMYMRRITAGMINVSLEHHPEMERQELLTAIAPEAFLSPRGGEGLRDACFRANFVHWWPGPFPHHHIQGLVESLYHLSRDIANVDDERGGCVGKEEAVLGEGLNNMFHHPHGITLDHMLPRLALSPKTTRIMHALNSSLASSWPLVDELCQNVSVLDRVAQGHCVVPSPDTDYLYTGMPGLFELVVHSMLCVIERELGELVHRIAQVRNRLAMMTKEKKKNLRGENEKQELVRAFTAESARILDRATHHLERQLIPALRVQRRLVEKIVQKFLLPCHALARLHDILDPLMHRQSAWWRLSDDQERISLVALPCPSQIAAELANAAANSIIPLLGDLATPHLITTQLVFHAHSPPLGCYNAEWISQAGFGSQTLAEIRNKLAWEAYWEGEGEEEIPAPDPVDWEGDFQPHQCG